jgi:glycerol-3-phosphate dehydrogenase (NAD(P)+)
MMERITVIGAGSWGTTVASLSAAVTETVLWARRPDLADSINVSRANPDYLPDLQLPPLLTATSDLAGAVDGTEAVIMAVPSHGFREVFARLAPTLSPTIPIVSLTKGIEQGSLATMTEVIAAVAPDHAPELIGVMSGPNLASEVAAGQPTATVIAMTDPGAALELQQLFMGPTFRVYTNEDVVGCELAGALKNVMALAAGMSDGLGFGDNTRATLITRALAELTRLGMSLGGRPETFAGLAGMGDLIATCSSHKSRNHRVGLKLAQGEALDDIVAEMNMVAEGIKTTRSVLGLAERMDVDMPIATHVGMVLDGKITPRQGMLSLMTREAKAESI